MGHFWMDTIYKVSGPIEDPRPLGGGGPAFYGTTEDCHEEGMTVVTATHSMDEAAQAQRIIVLSEGRIEVDADPPALFSKEKLLSDLKLGLPYTAKIASRLKSLIENDPATLLTINALADAIVKTLQKRGLRSES